MTCDFCETGTLHESVITREFQRDGYVLAVPNYKVSVCDVCGATVTTAEQARSNQLAKNAAEGRRIGVLEGVRIKEIRDRLSLSQADASAVFGGGPNSFYKYERSEVIVSKPMDLLLRLADEVPEAKAWLLSHAGFEYPRSEQWAAAPCSVVPFSSVKRSVHLVGASTVAANDWNHNLDAEILPEYAYGS